MTADAKNKDRNDVAESFPLAFLRDLVRIAPDRSPDFDGLLRLAGISPALLNDERAATTIEQASLFIRDLWRVTGDELVGLAPEPMPRGMFRMVALSLVHTADLRSALERFCEFSRLLGPLPTMSFEIVGDSVRVWIDVRGAGLTDPLAAGILLAFVQRFASWLISLRIDAKLVELPHAKPADTSNLDLVFAAPIRFGADEAALHFDAKLLDAPVMQDEESLELYLDRCPEIWLTRRDFGTTIVDRVQRILARGLMGDWPGQEELASSLAMSPQTLRRRLREQGTSVTEIKESIQRDAAIASLNAGEETVAELSTRLGFSEPSAFHRAFRRWTEQSPGTYKSTVGRDRSN